MRKAQWLFGTIGMALAGVGLLALFETGAFDDVERGATIGADVGAHVDAGPGEDSSTPPELVRELRQEPTSSPPSPVNIELRVVDSSGYHLSEAAVKGWAWAGTTMPSEATKGTPMPLGENDYGVFTFELPPDATHVAFEAQLKPCAAVCIERTREEALRGTRLVLHWPDHVVLDGRLLDSRREPWTRAMLEAWFGKSEHLEPTLQLRVLPGVLRGAAEQNSTCIDFDTARFQASVKRGFQGEVVLADGASLAAAAPWKDGDAPVDIVFEPGPTIAARSSLTMHLVGPVPPGAVEWQVERLSPTTIDYWEDFHTEPTLSNAGRTWSDSRMSKGAYRVRCRVVEDEETLVAALVVDLAAAEQREIEVPSRQDVDVRFAIVDEAGAPFADEQEIEAVLQDPSGASTSMTWFAIERASAETVLRGRLPVGSWRLDFDDRSGRVTVHPDGSCDPPIVRLVGSRRVTFRVGPLPRPSLGDEGRWVRARSYAQDGSLVDWHIAGVAVDAEGFTSIDFKLPSEPVLIDFHTRAYASATRVAVDVREATSAPIVVHFP